jgi:hypothetical protein
MALTSAEMGEELSSSLQVITDYFLAWQLQAAEYQRLSSRPVSLFSPAAQPIQYQFQKSPTDILSFTLRATRGDGDCFFHAVNQPGFTREALAQKLLECSGNEEVRRVFAHEIRQFLYLGHTGRHPNRQEDAACRVLLTRGIQPLFVTFLTAEEPLRHQVEVARTRLGEGPTRGKMPEELLGLLEEAHVDLVPAFRQAHSAVLEADEAIYRYCCQESVFREYVECYLREARGYIPFSRELGRELPITTIDVINRLFGLKIQVYLLRGRGEGRQLQLANQLQPGASTATSGAGSSRDSSVELAREAETAGGAAAGAREEAPATAREPIPIFHDGFIHFSGLNVFTPPRLGVAEAAGAREDRDSVQPSSAAAASASTFDRQSWRGGEGGGASSSALAGRAGGSGASGAASRAETTTRAMFPRDPVAHFQESDEDFARRLAAEDYVDRQPPYAGSVASHGYASAAGAHLGDSVDRQSWGAGAASGASSSASADRTAGAREAGRGSLPSFAVVAPAKPLPSIPYDRADLDEIIEELPLGADIQDKVSAYLAGIEKQVSDIHRYQSKKQPEHFYLAISAAVLEIHNIADALYDLTRPYHAIFPHTLKQLILKWISPLEAELKRLAMPASERDALQLRTKHLYAEQSFISREPSSQQALMQHLDKLKQLFEKPGHPDPRCYISYAWPSKENQEQEYWVQPFLSVLYDHLTAAGIRVVMDIRDNRPGDSIYQFMRRYHEGNYVILVGTESLREKHEASKTHAVQTELSIITGRFDQDQRQFGQSRIYPMLISGTIETAYPEIYDKYRTVRDARGVSAGYLSTLKALTDWMYADRLVAVKQPHAELWRIFNESCRALPRDFSTVEREVAVGYHRQRLDYLRQDIQYRSIEETKHSAPQPHAGLVAGQPDTAEAEVGLGERLARMDVEFSESVVSAGSPPRECEAATIALPHALPILPTFSRGAASSSLSSDAAVAVAVREAAGPGDVLASDSIAAATLPPPDAESSARTEVAAGAAAEADAPSTAVDAAHNVSLQQGGQ